MLAKQGINVFDSTQTKNAILSIQASLAIAGIVAPDASAIVREVKSSIATLTSEQAKNFHSPQSSLALHHAARSGDLAVVKQLVLSGSNVNAKDLFSATPLHMAAMYGHKAVAEFLINNGAEINAKTQKLTDYTFTPLDLAAQYAPNTEIITYLLNKGAQPDHWDFLVMGLFEDAMDSSDKKNYKAFDLALQKMEIVSQNKNALWVYSESEVKPILILYKVFASEINDAKYYERIMKTINHLTSADKTFLAERYVLAKNLLHAFPSDETYTYKIGPNKVKLSANGYYALFAVEIAAQTLGAFVQGQNTAIDQVVYQSLKSQKTLNERIMQSFDSYLYAKQQVFKTVESIFTQGINSAVKAGLIQTSETLFAHYESGGTIILPCGWDGHAIEIILNKELNLFMVANSGERFEGFASGLNAYHMQFDLTPDVIYSIINNQEQLELEFKKFYDLDLERSDIYSFSMPDQVYGNCAWYSQQIAQKALLYIELSKLVSTPELALSITEKWFEEYNEFHLTYVLKAYLEDPFLDEAALGDILITYHNHLETPAQTERSNLILEVLSENAHKIAFNSYLHEHLQDLTPEIKKFLNENGYKTSEASSTTLIESKDVLSWNDAELQQESLLPATPLLQSLLPVVLPHEEQIIHLL